MLDFLRIKAAYNRISALMAYGYYFRRSLQSLSDRDMKVIEKFLDQAEKNQKENGL